MSQRIEEQLSALLDGELPVEEEELLMKQLGRSAAHRATLGRYGLIRECIRGGAVEPAGLDLGERVRNALTDCRPDPVAQPRSGIRPRRIGRLAAGAAIAASVAVLALASLNWAGREPGAPAPARIAQTPVPNRSEAISYTVPLGVSGSRRPVLAPARLTGYLVSHGEYSNRLTRQVMDSRIVNQEVEPRKREVPSHE